MRIACIYFFTQDIHGTIKELQLRFQVVKKLANFVSLYGYMYINICITYI